MGLCVMVKSNQKSQLWVCFNMWRKESMAATVNYMRDSLKTQQYSQVNLQIKIMDLLNKNVILHEYSRFVKSLTNTNNKHEYKRLQTLISLLDKRDNRKRYFNCWYIKGCNVQRLIHLMETKIQLCRIAENIKLFIKANTSLGFTSVVCQGNVRKVNIGRISLKVN